MKLYLLDAEHCLGHALSRLCQSRGDVELITSEDTSTDAATLERLRPDAVLLPPLGRPADIDPGLVFEHSEAVERLLEHCLSVGVPLVWCVSDQIFEQGSAQPIEETAIPAPYDEGLKRMVSVGNLIRARLPEHFILRIGPLFGLSGRDAWLEEMLVALEQGETLRAAEDSLICPTSVEALAMALIGMLQQQYHGAHAWGAYHLAGVESVSPFTFLSVVRHQLETRLRGLSVDIEPGQVAPLHHHHDEPLKRILNCRRMLETFGIHQKPWRVEIDRMLERWCAEHHGGGETLP
ncbi:sugar nucleotide-binding protein [Kushneria phosphatilytica]|uniref:dTDP-4-dehydrorhamnose reductase n=1 Tax=Kushneria phosphatilytica TaxID=657387 RepID=A0A5C1A592_9GAMM|nr:sugar nucleotide-binding protein [Kushneria phosphatilytica]QEL12115.1 sugar nucleotide-binding protein [Kushneria phosphatilytica]